MADDTGDRRRIDDLVAAMTLEEKLSRVHGVGFGRTPGHSSGYVPPVERLDVPGVGMVDGPAGLNAPELAATDVPHPIVAASAFDPDLARELGAAIAREARAAGQDVLLAPTMDLFRYPLQSRAAETLGEDPHLAAALSAAYTEGVQSEGVVATAKHYTCYNQSDTDATPDDEAPSNHDVVVGERALRELYLPPFEAAVEAGAGAVMAAYNRVNGDYASENEYLLEGILKGEWGFDGFVVSDWLGTHSVDAARNGLDVEMPAGEHFGDPLAAAVDEGTVAETAVDEKVRRVLRALERTGAWTPGGSEGDGEGAPDEAGAAADTGSEDGTVIGADAHADLARRVAEEGSVLLANDGVLPFDPGAIDTLAVVGPEPRSFRSGVGGSDTAEPIREVGPVEGLEAVAGDGVAVEAVSSDEYRLVDPAALTAESGEAGLTGRYYDEEGADTPVHTRVDGPIDVDGEDLATAGIDPDRGGEPAIEWTGTLTPPASGSFGFRLTSSARATLSIDGERVVESEGTFFGAGSETGRIDLEAGERYDVDLAATGAVVRLEWDRPDVDWFGRAVDAAAAADAAVVVARSDTEYGTDRDRFGLPGTQDDLIGAVADVADTVVLLNTESPVAAPWVEDVAALLQVWFPGQEGGTAVANLLFGAVTPSGKLPVTFGASLEDYPPERPRGYPGVDGRIHYEEGVFLGYRGVDAAGTEPLFPFGHGESYTDFEYDDLRVAPEAVAPGESVEVTLRVRNAGDRAGAEVVQLYVAPVDPAVERPPRELAGVRKLRLAPDESAEVTFELGDDAVSFYHPGDGWTAPAGRFDVLAGRSSRDVRLEGGFERTAVDR